MENSNLTKKGSTLFLRGVLLLITIPIIVFSFYALPNGITNEKIGNYRPILIGMVVSTIFFYIALFQSLKLLSYIDKNKTFSDLSLNAIKRIKYSAICFSILYAAGMPYIYYVADEDDAPGVILIGMAFVFASFVLAIFAAVLQRLLQDALEIKSENDLTV